MYLVSRWGKKDYFSFTEVFRHFVQTLRFWPPIFLVWRLMAMVLFEAMLE